MLIVFQLILTGHQCSAFVVHGGATRVDLVLMLDYHH